MFNMIRKMFIMLLIFILIVGLAGCKNKNDKDENNKIINNKEDEETEYNNRYSKYMVEDFNITLVNMLIIYINKNKTLPNGFKKEPNFMNKFVNLIKHLLMNEVELAAFTILIDKIGWKHEKIDYWIYLTILGIYSKKLLGREEESSFLINIFSVIIQIEAPILHFFLTSNKINIK